MSERHGNLRPACPVFIVKSSGFHTDEALRALTVEKRFFPCLDCPTLLAGFQLLYQNQGGILAVEIKNKKDYLAFYRTLSALVRIVNPSTIRILIFSSSNEILASRAMAQFQFIRSFQLPRQFSRMAEILFRESKSLAQSATALERRHLRSKEALTQTPLLMIRGKAEAGAPLRRPTAAPTVLSKCVSPSIPTYLYGADLSWRVRGFYSNLDLEEGTLVFTATSDSAQKKLLGQLEAGPILLSSSSLPEGKVCSALEFVSSNKKEFSFRFPTTTKVIQRRAHARRRVGTQNQTLVRWHDPSMRADRLFLVFDYGASGIGFLVPKEEKLRLQKDDVLGPLFIYSQGREIEITKAIIRHVSKAESDSRSLLVGVEFQRVTNRHSALIEMMVFTGTL